MQFGSDPGGGEDQGSRRLVQGETRGLHERPPVRELHEQADAFGLDSEVGSNTGRGRSSAWPGCLSRVAVRRISVEEIVFG